MCPLGPRRISHQGASSDMMGGFPGVRPCTLTLTVKVRVQSFPCLVGWGDAVAPWEWNLGMAQTISHGR